jgi:NTE family protein
MGIPSVYAQSSSNSMIGGAGMNDGLAIPIPANPGFGGGKERAVVIGGGGAYEMAFVLGYIHELGKNGVAIQNADLLVGTSSGSIISSSIANGHLFRVTTSFELMGMLSKYIEHSSSLNKRNPSQLRAVEVANNSTTADVAAIQALGRAAMASHNEPPEALKKSIQRMSGVDKWTSDKLLLTAIDCYSGERIVMAKKDNVPILDAIMASSADPGAYGPQWIKNRYCMDGGMCQTSTHADLAKGAKRVLLFSLNDGTSRGARLTSMPNILQQEVADLKAGGTRVNLVVAGAPAGVNVLSTKAIEPAMAEGIKRAKAEAEMMRQFWA